MRPAEPPPPLSHPPNQSRSLPLEPPLGPPLGLPLGERGGEPLGPPLLVAVHGWLLSGQLWQPLRQALAPRFELWCPDLPGFGERRRPRGLQPNLASYGRWLAERLQAEAPGRPLVLLGHSLGGSVALHAAPLLGPQLRGMVQVAAGGGVYQPRVFGRVRQGGMAFLALRPSWLGQVPALAPWRGPLVAEARAARSLLATSTNRGAVQQLPRLTAALQVPSLWIAGSRDTVMEARYVRHMAAYTPGHRLELLEGAGHLPMCQMPAALAALIAGWLEETGIAAAPAEASREARNG
jgi:2-succinyl-6-hydroxy-2,4-cyclohexadiene-1-carboxylate synthase